MIILPEPVYTEYWKECSILTQKYITITGTCTLIMQKYSENASILVHACTHMYTLATYAREISRTNIKEAMPTKFQVHVHVIKL